MADIYGTNNDDTLNGTSGADLIDGLDGNDQLYGGDGSDTLEGGEGNDIIRGGDGFDLIYGGSGNDILMGNGDNEDDYIHGTSDGAWIYGGDGNDILYAMDDQKIFTHYEKGNGANLYGGNGDDQLYGANGTTDYYGGQGNDTLYLNPHGDSFINLDNDWGHDTIVTNAGENYWIYLYFDDATVDLNLDFNAFTNQLLFDGSILSWENSLEFFSVEGGQGNDTIYISGTMWADGGDGNDTIYGNANNNSFVGDNGIDHLYGFGGNDSFTMDGKGIEDYFFGGADNDKYAYNIGRYNFDPITQFIQDDSGSDDRIVFTDTSSDSILSYEGVDSDNNGYWDKLIIHSDTNQSIEIENYFDNNNNNQSGTGLIESFEFDDTTLYFNEINTLAFAPVSGSTSGNDTLQGNNYNNQVDAGDGNDTLYGQGGNDTLFGGTGNDFIDGGPGVDSMNGGDGDDVFVVDDENDTVFEVDGQGYDTVLASVDYTMSANVEKLRMQGSNDLTATGNDSDNQIFGNAGNNSLDGGAGNDVLNGGAGDDAMVGGAGDDFYYVDTAGDSVTEVADEGIDTVYATISYTAGDHVENVRLFGAGNMDATGNALDNKLTGTSGSNTLDGGDGNDTLDGGSGVDTLIGGTGDDWYLIRNSNDVIVENAGEGDVDYAFTYVNYTLSDNIEQLRMYGNTNLTGTGNAGDNALYGNYGNNTINGLDGNDFIDGGAGGDVMRGGVGDDVIVIDSVLDNVIELADEGYDTVLTKANYTMADNIEKLRMQTNANLNATGNDLDNVMIGNSGDNTINGGAGDDNIVGLGGADTFAFDLGSGLDSIGDFTNGTDLLDVSGWNIADFNDLIITAVDSDTTVAYEADGADMITLQNVDVVDIDAADFVFA